MRKIRNFIHGKLFPCALIALLWGAGLVFFALFLPRWLAPLAALERLVSLLTGIAVLLSRDTPESKLSKLVLLLLLPWTGAILCFLWRRRPRTPSPSPRCGGGDVLVRAAALSEPFTDASVTRANGLTYFPTGREAFRALLRDVSAAKSYIWLEYYIVARGALFNRLFFALRKKAEEGLDVRLLYDGFGSSLTLSAKDVRQLNAAGILTQEARPLTVSPKAVNRRNHRKIAVIDGEIAYTGGINLADEYTGEKLRFGNWKDSAVRVTGETAAVFTSLLCKTLGKHPPARERGAEKRGNIPCAVIADDAEDCVLRAGAGAFGALIGSANKTLYLFTPYLAPDGTLLRELKRSAAAGVDVRVMIPHIPDKKVPFLLTRHFARELERAGAKAREYTDGFLHAKCATADGEYAFVSSYNLDYRSLYLQAECGLLARDAAFCADVERDFLQAWETGTPVPRERFFARISRMLVQLFLPFL